MQTVQALETEPKNGVSWSCMYYGQPSQQAVLKAAERPGKQQAIRPAPDDESRGAGAQGCTGPPPVGTWTAWQVPCGLIGASAKKGRSRWLLVGSHWRNGIRLPFADGAFKMSTIDAALDLCASVNTRVEAYLHGFRVPMSL